jgi:hypothetical protein
VQNHLLNAALEYSTEGQGTALLHLSNIVAPVRMPGLMMVAGYFAAGSLAKRGAAVFVSTKMASIAYPAFVWSLVMGALYWLEGGDDKSLSLFIDRAIGPGYLWFLWYLIAFFAAAPLILVRKSIAIAFAIGTGLFVILVPQQDKSGFVMMLHFFIVGNLLPRSFTAALRPLAFSPVAMLSTAVLAIVPAALNWGLPLDWATTRYALQAYTLIPILILLCVRMDETRLASTAKSIGGHSLEVYILHVPIIIVILRFMEPLNVGFYGAAGVLIASLIPLLVLATFASRRWGRWLFKPPQFLLAKLPSNPAPDAAARQQGH